MDPNPALPTQIQDKQTLRDAPDPVTYIEILCATTLQKRLKPKTPKTKMAPSSSSPSSKSPPPPTATTHFTPVSFYMFVFGSRILNLMTACLVNIDNLVLYFGCRFKKKMGMRVLAPPPLTKRLQSTPLHLSTTSTASVTARNAPRYPPVPPRLLGKRKKKKTTCR